MKAKPGKANELRAALLALVDPTHREEGCAQYDLHVNTANAGEFVFFERWTSRELLDRHLASAHLQAFVATADQLLAEPAQIETYDQIG